MLRSLYRTEASRTLLAASLALCAAACLNELDFDSVEPRCEAPRFDDVTRDQFCGGLLDQTTPITIPASAIGPPLYLSDAGPARALAAYATPIEPEPLGITSDVSPLPFFSALDLALTVPEDDFSSTTTRVTYTIPSSDDYIFSISSSALVFDAPTLIAVNVGNALGLADFSTGELTVEPQSTRLPLAYGSNEGSLIELVALPGASPERRVLIASAFAGLKPLYLVRDGDTWREDIPSLTEGEAATLYTTPCVANCAGRQACIERCRTQTDRCPECGPRLAFDLPQGATALASHDRLETLYVCGYAICRAMDRAALDPWATDDPIGTLRGALDGAATIDLPLTAPDGSGNVVHLPLRARVLGDTLFVLSAMYPNQGDDLDPLRTPSQPVLLAIALDPDTGAPLRTLTQQIIPFSGEVAFAFDLTSPQPQQLVAAVHHIREVNITSAGRTQTVPFFQGREVTLFDVARPEAPRVLHAFSTEGLPNQYGIATRDGGAFLLDGQNVQGARVTSQGDPLP